MCHSLGLFDVCHIRAQAERGQPVVRGGANSLRCPRVGAFESLVPTSTLILPPLPVAYRRCFPHVSAQIIKFSASSFSLHIEAGRTLPELFAQSVNNVIVARVDSCVEGSKALLKSGVC